MARQGIFTGSSPNDGTGDSLVVGAVKVNQNFSEIYTTFGDGNNLVSYVNSSGISTYSSISGVATYASSAGVATYSTLSGVSTYASTAGIATYSPISGVSTYTSVAGYSTSSGIATVAQGLTGTPNINAGIITATSFIGDGSGLTGIVGTGGAGSGVIIKDSGNLVGTAGTIDFGNNLTVSAISAGVVTVTASGGGESYWTSNPTGIHTFSNVGIGTTNPPADLSVYGDVFVSGFSTFANNVYIGDGKAISFGAGNDLQILHDGNNSYIDNSSVGNLIIRDSGTGIQLKKTSGALMGVFNNDAGVELYYDGVLKFQTFQNGVAINESVGIGSTAGNPPYRLTVSGVGATITQGLANAIADFTSSVNGYGQVNVRNSLSGTNASGDVVITANTGTDTSNFIDLGINNTGFATTSWTINGALDGYLYTSDGNLSIGAASVSKYLSLFAGGTLAANEQARVTSTGVGIGTTIAGSKLTVEGDGRFSGVVTATRFQSTSSGTPTIDSPNNLNINAVTVAISTDVTIGRELTISGITTINGGGIGVGGIITANSLSVSGIITSSGFNGNLSGTASTVTTSNQNYLRLGSPFNIYSPSDELFSVITDRNLNNKKILIDYGGKMYFGSKVGGSLDTGGFADAAMIITPGNEGGPYSSIQLDGHISAGGTIGGSAIFTNQLNASGIATATSFRSNSTVGDGTDVGFAIKYYITASGFSAYRFAGPGLVNTTDNPTIYLHRGFTYIFENSTGGSHPFAIRYSSGGTGYGSTYLSGSQSGTQIFTVPFDAPATLVYQCTIHSGMLGTFNIVT